MKKLSGIILAGAMVLSMGTQVFAADTNNGNHYGWEKGSGSNNGNHYGWEKGTNNPHKSEVTPPVVDIEDPTVESVTSEEMIAIVNDLKQSSTINARYEDGRIRIGMVFNLAAYDWSWSIINKVLDNHNVKVVDYMVEEVIWDCPDGSCTGRWGTVSFKVAKN